MPLNPLALGVNLAAENRSEWQSLNYSFIKAQNVS